MSADGHQVGAPGVHWPWAARAAVLLLVFALGDWLLLKMGLVAHPPWVLALLVGLLISLLALLLVGSMADLVRRRRSPGAGLGRLLLLSGLVTLLLGGLGNWLLGLQGYVILLEGEEVPLHGGSHLQEFDAGPLARVDEMHLLLRLTEVEVLRGESGRIEPRSRLAVRHGLEEPVELVVRSDASAAFAPLVFHQGAFGFAPRIAILKDGQAVFERTVPFTTRRAGAGTGFEGLFTIARERLEVEGAVDLASLDEALRGHATLRLTVRRDGVPLGSGALLPGHFAEIDEGYRIGFVGLEKWSEIDLSRRTYGSLVLAGAGVALLGGLLWPVAAWRGF